MIDKKYQIYMYELVDRVLKEIGPRASCSENERRLGRLLEKEWGPLCDEVKSEPFRCSPSAFLGIVQLSAVAYMAALIFYFTFPPAAFLILLAFIVLLYFQFIRYCEVLDPLYPQRESINTIGIIRPNGEIRRRVIVSGHMDSAYEFNIWLYLKNLSLPFSFISVAGFLFLLVISFMRSMGISGFSYGALGVIAFLFLPFALAHLFFHTYKPVPGAMDDMAGVAVAAGLGQYLKDARASKDFFPEHTEVVIIGMGSEEAGLRGAKRYAAAHRDELKSIPTYGIFLDGIYDEKYLTVVSREFFTGAKHDAGMVQMAMDVSRERGFRAKKLPIPIGASDASAFSLAGIPSTCLLCQDTSRLVPHYHTRHDTIEHVRPQSMGVCLQIVVDMIERIDTGK